MKRRLMFFLIILLVYQYIIISGCTSNSSSVNIGTKKNTSKALLRWNLEAMKECLENNDVNINEVTYSYSILTETKNPLYEALDSRRYNVMQFLLEHGADPNYSDKYGNTLLMYTVGSRKGKLLQEHMIDSNFTRLLIQYEADINITNKDGYTALDFAAENNNGEMVKLLLSSGANVTTNTLNCALYGHKVYTNNSYGMVREILLELLRAGYSSELDGVLEAAIIGDSQRVINLIDSGMLMDEYKNSILLFASAFCDIEVFKKLSDYDMKLYVKDDEGNSTINISASYGNLEVLKYLLEKSITSEVIEDINKEKGRALNAALYHNQHLIAEHLIEEEISLSDKSIFYGGSPLESAAKSGNVDNIELLLSNSYPQPSNMELFNTLEIVIQNSNNDILKYLLNNGINVNLSYKNSSLLERACHYRNFEAVKLLVQYGANPNGTGIKGLELKAAVEAGDIEIVQYLIDNGADVNQIIKYTDGSEDDSPLLLACYYGYFDIIKLLVSNGAKIEYHSEIKGNISPLPIVAGESNHILQFLLGYSININYQDCNGRTALMNAVENSHLENTLLLINSGADVNLQDNDGLTAMDIAERNEDDMIIKLLEEKLKK